MLSHSFQYLRLCGSCIRSQETGLPISVCVKVGEKTFKLHKVGYSRPIFLQVLVL